MSTSEHWGRVGMIELGSYRVPRGRTERERLRQKGQFWTPDWIARAMVSFALGGGARTLFDPAVGAGAFFLAAKQLGGDQAKVGLRGCELHSETLVHARRAGLGAKDLLRVEPRDFVQAPPRGKLDAIVANPPYIRHHRLAPEVKSRLHAWTRGELGLPIDGRAGLHVFFLLRALTLLAPGGRLAFILPADTFEGVFARDLWSWILQRHRLCGVVTFAPQASPFPGVDTNPLIVLLSNQPPRDSFAWATCTRPTPRLLEWCSQECPSFGDGDLHSRQRFGDEALRTGLSRPPRSASQTEHSLGSFVRVRRGIASGANDFFFMTRARARALAIPKRYLVPAIGRTRDVTRSTLARRDMDELDRSGRPTLLLSVGDEPLEKLPLGLRVYLRKGRRQGLGERALLSTRRPWYRMETREPPPFLFAYLGRRHARFIRNRARVVPLTGFLCIYPRPGWPEARIWNLLRDPLTRAGLRWVGKSYGGGAVKVEPRALERLPAPRDLLSRLRLLPSARARITLA